MSNQPLLPTVPATVLSRASFKRLRMRHRRVLTLHLKGARNVDIARALKCSEAYIGTILSRDDSKALLAPAYAERIEQLVPKAIDALERNLECGDPGAEVRAADVALKASGRYTAAGENKATAEDVIERVLERISPDGTTTRAIERRALRLNGSQNEVQVP